MRRLLPGALLGLIALVLLSGVGSGSAAPSVQSGQTRGQPWPGARGVVQRVSDIVARQRRKDERRGGGPRGVHERPEPGEGRPLEPKLPGPAVPQPRQSAPGEAAPGQSTALATGSSFLGAQLSESGYIPPDSMGSVGPTQVLVAVNGRIKVFDKQGNLGALNVDDLTFFAPVRNGADVTDPQVEYDRLSGRWFIAEVNTESADNRVMLAVSSGSTITSSSDFTFFYFNQNSPPPAGGSGLFADYPQMGVDKNAVYVGANNFSSTFEGTDAFVIRKSSVLGAGPIVVTAFRDLAVAGGSGPFAPQPAQDMDPGVGEGYIVGVDNLLFSQLDVRRVSDPGGTPTISGNLTVPVPATYFPADVPAQGTHNSLDAIDDRLFEAMIARKPSGVLALWTAHNIGVDSSGVASSSSQRRDAARWYELGSLSSTPGLVQSGTLFDSASSNPRFFWIPSIAANGQGHASLNMSTAGSGRYAEIASTGRLAADAAGTLQPFELTQTSSSSYDVGSGSTKRWGDYSQTVVDPTDNMTFWTFQEYANATDSWGVRVIERKAPPPATPWGASPATLPVNDASVSVQITGTSTDGSGFFDPGPDTGGPGFPDHISASVSGGVVVNGITYTDPTHVTLDLDTTGAPNGSKDVTIINPDGQSSTASNLVTVSSLPTSPVPTCKGRPATLVGTPGPDVITGTPGRDVVAALAGNDRINTLAGNDLVCAGPGNDRVFTGNGVDRAYGQAGADRIYGGAARDFLFGQAGNDRLFGQAGNDLLVGNSGRDFLFGGAQRDALRGLRGRRDLCNGGPGRDVRRAPGCEIRRSIP